MMKIYKHWLTGKHTDTEKPREYCKLEAENARLREELATFNGENMNRLKLPDGSAFVVLSFPLPEDHWLYAPPCEEWDAERDTSADTPRPIVSNEQREAVKAAIRWAVRGATMNGREMDFDPDALVLNAAYALCEPCVLNAHRARKQATKEVGHE